MRHRGTLPVCLGAALALWLAPLVEAQRGPRKPKERVDPLASLRPSIARFRGRVEAILAGKLSAPTPPGPTAADAAAKEAEVPPIGPEKGDWAVLVVEAATGETLYALHPERYFTPASNTKLFTTALALATLGPDYRFRTTLETRATLDRHGRLRGDLVLVGRGDPNLSNRKFPYEKQVETEGPPEKILAALADGVVAQGVKQIEGDIVADDSYFVYARYPSGWSIDDMTHGYAAPVTAIALNDNALNVEVHPGEREGDAAWFAVEPWAEFYEFENQITTGPAGPPPAPIPLGPEEPSMRAEREPGSRRIVLRGQIPLGSESETLLVAIEEPAEYTAVLLKRLLELRGVRVYGRGRARHAPDPEGLNRVVLAEHTSLPLIEAIRVINKASQNLHTEMLLRVVARERTGTGSTEAGLKLAQEFFRSIGIEEADVAVYDGSGLSRRNLITPRAAVRLLQYVARQPWGEAYLATLPVAGQDGTLDRRMKDTPAAGRIQAKTGTLGSVNALSGYATTLHGTRLIFSLFGNKHNLRGHDATEVLDAICVAMVEEIGAPPPRRKR